MYEKVALFVHKEGLNMSYVSRNDWIYSRVPLQRGPIYHNITYCLESNIDQIQPTKDIPYLVLRGDLWAVCYEDLGENGPCFKGTALYRYISQSKD